jgi:hypothetical protein
VSFSFEIQKPACPFEMVPTVSVVGCDIVDGAACGLGGAYTEFRIRVGDAYVFRRYSQFR